MKPQDLQEHITATYFTLRSGLIVLGTTLPFVLWIGGSVRGDLPLQPSMSAYYHAHNGIMRDEFVGVLWAVGVCLYLYKGYTRFENYALNLAGVFAVCIALFPMRWNCAPSCSSFSPHGMFAVLFFLVIAYVCVFRASDTLSLMSDAVKATRYKRTYRALGIGMIASPVAAVILTSGLQIATELRPTVFLIEAGGVLVFATYWLVKSREVFQTNSERSAIEGKLRMNPSRVWDAFKVVPAIHVEVANEGE